MQPLPRGALPFPFLPSTPFGITKINQINFKPNEKKVIIKSRTISLMTSETLVRAWTQTINTVKINEIITYVTEE